MHPQKCIQDSLAHWGSEYVYAYRMNFVYYWLCFYIVLIIMPLLHHLHTHLLATSTHLIFIWALPQTEK